MTELEEERIALDATVENCGLFRERIAQLEDELAKYRKTPEQQEFDHDNIGVIPVNG